VIDVAFTRAELRPADLTVVIDVLRATSTATTALYLGFAEVVLVESVEQAAGWRASGRLLAGERNCRRPAGFDFGNSPLELSQRSGGSLVLATTNGAPAIVAAAEQAATVVLACLLNLGAVVAALQAGAWATEGTVQIVCSGTDGAVALEDVYVAGRICAALTGERSDAAYVAESVARAHSSALEALAKSANAAVLRSTGMAPDIVYCAQESVIDLVPRVAAAPTGAAVVRAATGVGQRRPIHLVSAAFDHGDTVGWS
jgi:2-phosphosulfolactate phosphatase